MTDRANPARTPLFIDTDGGSDDAVALVLAAASGLGRVVGVGTVAGNVPLAQATRNVLYALEVAGAGDVPVYRGCHRPLIQPLRTAQRVHGEDGMGDADLPPPAGAPRPGHAADALVRLAYSQAASTLTLVTLGPLTNIAAALIRDRDLLTRFCRVYCMAGAADGVGNISPTAEYNMWADPEAAEIVLDAARPELVTLVGWDVSRRDAVMTPADQQVLRATATPLAWFADRINRAVDSFAGTVTGLAGYDLPDPLTVAIALRPDLIGESQRCHARVVLAGEARGQLLIDRRRSAPPPNVTIVRRADGPAFKALLLDTCAAPVPHPATANTLPA